MAMQFYYKETTVRLHGKAYKICIPIYNFVYTFVNQHKRGVASAIVYSSKEDLNELAKALFYFSQSKDTVLYIPCNKTDIWKNDMKAYAEYLDLLLVNHSTQFKRKYWKDIRAKLKKSVYNNRTFEFDETQITSDNYDGFCKTENKDFMDLNMNYSTLFLTGSKRTFHSLSEDCLTISKEEYSTRFPSHFHGEYMMRDNRKDRTYENDVIFYLFHPKLIETK